MTKKNYTTAPVQAGTVTGVEPEFVRIPQLSPLAGIKRGIAYRRINDGTFKSILIREPGNVQGVRLVYWPSVRSYLHKLMIEQRQLPLVEAQKEEGL